MPRVRVRKEPGITQTWRYAVEYREGWWATVFWTLWEVYFNEEEAIKEARKLLRRLRQQQAGSTYVWDSKYDNGHPA